jgi:mannose-6-phosphate isomerase-like protein (cupin superfamily)
MRRWQTADTARRGFHVARDADRFGARRSVGIVTLAVKVATADSGGVLLVLEIAHHAQGGPARHLHHQQDEWFHVIAGDDVIEIGGERYRLGPRDSAFGPRGVTHGWTRTSPRDGPQVSSIRRRSMAHQHAPRAAR